MPLGMRYPLACGFMGLLQTDTKKRPLSGRFERENALSRIFVGYRAHITFFRCVAPAPAQLSHQIAFFVTAVLPPRTLISSRAPVQLHTTVQYHHGTSVGRSVIVLEKGIESMTCAVDALV